MSESVIVLEFANATEIGKAQKALRDYNVVRSQEHEHSISIIVPIDDK